MRIRVALFLLCVLFAPLVARAVTPAEALSDPRLEAEARAITRELRCLVCQNQSIDDSDAPLAHDLRVLVRDRLKAGDSPDDAKAFVVERYGEFVLLRPPFRPGTYLLWLGPALVLVLGIGLLFGFYRRQQGAAVNLEPRPLSATEDAKLRSLKTGSETDGGEKTP